MAICKSLKTLINKNLRTRIETRPFFTATGTGATTVITTTTLFLNPPLYYIPFSHRTTLLSRWIAPFQFHGPLFLSSPPWKLLQSATPLNGVVLRKVQALNLDLIRSRTGFPSKLGFGSGLPRPNLLDRVESKEEEDVARNGLLKSFVNLPNLVSVSRMISGPFIGCFCEMKLVNKIVVCRQMITSEMYSSAFVALAISGATDWLDGYLARRMKIDSVVGSYLDPLADKVLIGSVAVAMVHMDLLHPGLVGLIVLRDVALVGGAFYQRASSLGGKWKSWIDFFNIDGTCTQKVEPLFLSKVNTVFQLILVAAALLQPEFGTLETQSYITYLSILVASTTAASTAAYGAQYMRKRSALLTRNT
ncbi:hypothetical protein EZV62_026361 [Acer yangbiense]|uniref:CDP-diacylglycerol--glycerol-3-phosphate 3-phosphatidyltransferase n=1 Tax=Acer yangbiense TaxID=1000413 RepID=A0A5C7GRI4_9ROSI|nr:hypothetical protein EZV62_026361 [Acer yangbiense]